MTYRLDAHNGYWAAVIGSDIAKGRTAQQSCSDIFRAILTMGRSPEEAMKVAEQAAYLAGIAAAVRW